MFTRTKASKPNKPLLIPRNNWKRNLDDVVLPLPSKSRKPYSIDAMFFLDNTGKNITLVEMKRHSLEHELGIHKFSNEQLRNQRGIIWYSGLYKRAQDDSSRNLVEYRDPKVIESLLSSVGLSVLGKLIQLIQHTSKQENWPLSKIEIEYIKHYEIENWQYVKLLLFFETDFEKADEYLHSLYPIIDDFALKLTNPEQLILQKSIFFDVRANLS
jgi:hypothetical protein